MKNAKYGSSLTDAQWEYLKPMLPQPAKPGRPPTDLRQVIDGIFYVVKGGIPWRYLPAGFPPWQTVYGIFRRWKRTNLWAALNDALRILIRKAQGKRGQPTAAILDSQSVKSAGHGGEVGYDAGKRIKGRKRHSLVDTLGLVLGVAVTPASTTERDGAKSVLLRVLAWFTWLRRLWVDGGYTGAEFASWVKTHRPKLNVEVVKRSDDVRGFKVLPRRWVVERTFGWLLHHRRLVRDYETTITSAEAFV
ncbi:MAG: IS5 family transposase [Verrucomicrobiota bacterium]|nr:IS5 family transposase [Verrucomicrobiota bacterium]MDE3067287.1 IS5 family transposase [Verrucomicrobiota bacterium]